MDKSSPHDLAQMRKSYELAELDEAQVAPEPIDQFHRWFDEAVRAKALEPNAMTVATVGADGRPSTRVLLLKGADAQGLVWFTNYESRKGHELAANPFAAMQFFWGELERVVRIEGRVERVSDEESDAYYGSRPLGSRIGAWVSPQSRVLTSRSELEAAWARQQAALGDDPPRPPHWGGYRLVPDRWEFWQGRPSRLHDRIVYQRLADGTWQRQRLAP
ncbi:pyridoxamine 5'-phosphate oxidase [Aquabacterium olei]|uniref:Pyridoxine/pyridoxamine 5'-phosphate oxidase n=1 Tax=Aquabacterium olei TaxID=1296669 RepID=A0A2U8FNW5_9BURK|nr:pyridoxamine 5'-phosphate oxidase [Aquabacterium olei]AWI52538.1 pyridoxamine 5'-phosphate oxidase [Aquabacterium olei]